MEHCGRQEEHVGIFRFHADGDSEMEVTVYKEKQPLGSFETPSLPRRWQASFPVDLQFRKAIDC